MSARAVLQANGCRRPGLRARLMCSVLAVTIGLQGMLATAVHAAPLAGTVIDNTATATYFDTDRGFNATLRSNTVQVNVQALEALTLTSDTQLTRAGGGIANLPHRLTNTGNAPSTYLLGYGNRADDSLDLLGLQLVHDRNGNGVADGGELPIANGGVFGPLAPGEFADLVLVGTLPTTALVGEVARLNLTARSSLQGASASNVDTVTVADGAQLQLLKSASNLTPRRGDTVTFTLSASNVGNQPASGAPVTVNGVATNLLLIRDMVPANTTLVALGAAGVAQPLYHLAGQQEHSYVTAAPADLRQVDAVAFGFADAMPPRQSHVRSFDVRVNSNAAGPILNVGQLWFMNGTLPQPLTSDSNAVRLLVPETLPRLTLFNDPAYTREATVLSTGRPLFVAFDAARCNVDPMRVETTPITIRSPLTGDVELYAATETGTNTGMFRIEPNVPTTATAAVQGDGRVSTGPNDRLAVSARGCGATELESNVLVDPFGVVFDSKTNAPVPGATVQLIDVTGAGNGGRPGGPAIVFLADGITRAPDTVVTGADGGYQFPLVAPSTYRLVVTPPASFAFPSTLAMSLLPADRVVAEGSYGQNFVITRLSAPVQLDVPVDADPRSGFFIEKSASRQVVELGEFIDYQIKVKNVSGQLLGGIRVNDFLPAGFAYLPGSARLDGGRVRYNGSALPEPEGGTGPALVFNVGSLDNDKVLTLSYRVRVGPGALQGDGTNRAQATTAGPLAKLSNESRVVVQVRPGVFSDRGFLLGNVYADCDNNQQRDDGEPGIPGVRLYLQDGTHVTTDLNGRYSLYGLRAQTHVLKLDVTSLPFALGAGGERLALLANRQAGDAGSRFIDMKNGELQRADFAVAGCSDGLRTALDERASSAKEADREQQRSRDARLSADLRPVTVSDPKALPASGTVGKTGSPNLPSTRTLPQAADTDAAPPRAPAPQATPLSDEQMAAWDNTPQIVSPIASAVLGYAQTGIVAKGVLGASLTLRVNDAVVPATRIGRHSKLESRKLQVLEFIGINLLPGANTLELTQSGINGQPDQKHAVVVRAPGAPSQLRLVTPGGDWPADGRSKVQVSIEPLDVAGVPVTAPTAVTLTASHGRWLVRDLDPREPGVQVFVEGGKLIAELESPNDAGDVQLQATSGNFTARATLAFVPSLRPLIAVGLVEGVFNFRNLDPRSVQTVRTQDGFEQALSRVGASFDNGRGDAQARTAVFLKGKVLGSTLLTLAFDSDKDKRERLFRDIQPGEFYPIYGDDSVQGFDAQSTGRLYVKLERGKSSLLYGDYSTQVVAPLRPNSVMLEERRLGQFSRSLNGARAHVESDDSRSSVTAFASQTASRRVVDELRALGISGPYALSRAPIVENSEKVELLTRDRDQPGLILQSRPLQRFVDYEVEQLTGRLLFKGPVPSFDAAFNPQSLRVTYEVDGGGPKVWVGGVSGRYELTDYLTVSAGAVRDNDPLNPLTLSSVGATFMLTPQTAMHMEQALSNTPLGTAASGQAARVELRHDSEHAKLHVQAVRASAGFANPSAGVSAGRQEINIKGSVPLDEQTSLKAEALRTDDQLNATKRIGAQVFMERRLTDTVRAEFGLRHSGGTQVDSPAAPGNSTSTTSLRGKLTAQVPGMAHASVFTELEQDLDNASRKVAAVGGEYRIDATSRVYLRHEFISSLGNRYGLNDGQQRNASVFGVQTDYATDANLFSEYRLRDAQDGRETEVAVGLRNRWKLGDGWSVSTGFERVHSLGLTSTGTGAAGTGNTTTTGTAATGFTTTTTNTNTTGLGAGVGSGESKVVALGVEYTGSPDWKGSSRLEARGSRNVNSLLSITGVAYKLDDAWSALGRNTLSVTEQAGASKKEEAWLQLGLAWREAGANLRNALLRGEYKVQRGNDLTLADSRRHVAVVSAHGSQHISPRVLLNGRIATKSVRETSIGQSNRYHAELASVRLTYDLSEQWDVSAQAALLIGNGGRARQHGLGAELGYRLADNLWLSGGWNVFGFSDRDLAAQDHTQRGVFVRLRWKFDERLFGSTP